MTAKMDLAASRNVAWAPTIDLFYPGDPLQLVGAAIAMEVRLYPGATGAPLAEMSAIAFEDLPASEEGGQRCLRLLPAIAGEILTAFPTGLNQPEPGEADTYSYDIVLTYVDGLQDKLAIGSFVLEPGVTRP